MNLKKNIITSLANPRIKEALDLRDSANRKEKKLFLIEGLKELELALTCGVIINSLYFCPEGFSTNKEPDFIEACRRKNVDIIELGQKAYLKIAFGNRHEGLIGVGCFADLSLAALKLKERPLIAVAEAIEKPGNIGAMLRTADACGVDAFILASPLADIYNPNVIRSSLGAVFSVKMALAKSEELVSWLKDNKIKIICAAVGSNEEYTSFDYRLPCAIVFGSEEKGLSDIWLKSADKRLKIPMKGKVDSLNVSVACGAFLFESLRQRSI